MRLSYLAFKLNENAMKYCCVINCQIMLIKMILHF